MPGGRFWGLVARCLVLVVAAPAAFASSYTMGTHGSNNVCPAGSVGISSVSECQAAATAIGGTYKESGSWGGDPQGCFQRPSDKLIWYNSATGRANSLYTPVCKQTATSGSTTTTTATTTAAKHICPSGTTREGGYYIEGGSTTPDWLPPAPPAGEFKSKTRSTQQTNAESTQKELGEATGYTPAAADVENCFPIAVGAGKSEMGKCSTCAASQKLYRQANSAGVYTHQKQHEDYYRVLYKVDDDTGCAACPAGTVPWQIRALSQSRYDSISCHSDSGTNECRFTNNYEDLQTDCDTATCGGRFIFCRPLQRSNIECSPGVSHNSLWGGGTIGITKGSCHGSNPMECIKQQSEIHTRIYDSKGMVAETGSGTFKGRWDVVCSVWKVVACTYQPSGVQKCSSAARIGFVRATCENNYGNAAVAKNAVFTGIDSIANMPIGMRELHSETGLCATVAQAEG